MHNSNLTLAAVLIPSALGLAAILALGDARDFRPAFFKTFDHPPAEHTVAPIEASPVSRPTEVDRAQLAASLKPRFDAAVKAQNEATEEAVEKLDAFFEKASRGTGPFAESALSFRSKWALAMDMLPGTGSGRQAKLLKQSFENHVFSSEQLESLIEEISHDVLRSIEDAENRLLVEINADIDTHGLEIDLESLPSRSESIATFMESAGISSNQSLKTNAKQLVIAGIIERVLQQAIQRIATRAGVSTALLGAGATTSTMSMGASIAASFAIDYVIAVVWDWFSDPQGSLEASLNEQLTVIHQELLAGDEQQEGLVSRLQAVGNHRFEELYRSLPESLILR